MNRRPDPSADPHPTAPRRPWWRLHRSTSVVAAVACAMVVLANVPGQVARVPNLRVPEYEWLEYPMRYQGGLGSYVCILEHGWPAPYLWRSDQWRYPQSQRHFWSLHEFVLRFSGIRLVCDLVVCLAIVGLAVAAYEAWRRRRARLLQFHLRELLVLTTLLAIVMAWLVAEQRQFRSESEASEAPGVSGAIWLSGGPTWLRALFGYDRFCFLDRVVCVSMVGRPDADDAARVTPPRLSHVEEDSCSDVQDLRVLTGFPRLRALFISESESSQCAQLDELPRLVSLSLVRSRPKDADFVRLARLHQLRHLDLSAAEIGDRGLENLTSLQRLETLDLGMTHITGAGLAHIGALRNLRRLNLRSDKITDPDLAHLGGLSRLSDLTLESPAVTGDGLKHLEGLRNLESLDMHWIGIGSRGLAHLRPFVHLQQLCVDPLELNDDDLEHLGALTEVKRLWLRGAGITDAGLAHLREMKDLEILTLRKTSISGPGLAHLRGMRKLKVLSLDDSPVTDQAVEHLEVLTNLEYLYLQNTKTSDVARRRLYHALPRCDVLPVPAGLRARRVSGVVG